MWVGRILEISKHISGEWLDVGGKSLEKLLFKKI